MTLHQALSIMLSHTAIKANTMATAGYSDSDYDVMENYLTVTTQLLTADYEEDPSLLPTASEAPWCPEEVINFLKEHEE